MIDCMQKCKEIAKQYCIQASYVVQLILLLVVVNTYIPTRTQTKTVIMSLICNGQKSKEAELIF
jgi:hypothetical protein